MLATATQLIGVTNTPVKVVNKEIPAGGIGFDKYQAHKFPQKTILVLNANRVGARTVEIVYLTPKGRSTVVVPSDFAIDRNVRKDRTLDRLWASLDGEVELKLPAHLELYHSFKVGSDPEIFVEDKNGQVIPAFEFLGSKHNPGKTAHGTYGNLPMYWDGFQAEFVTSAQNCLAWQVDSVQTGLKGVIKAALKKFPDAKLSTKTVVDVRPDVLADAKDEHVDFGCMPSLNAYGLEGLKIPGREVSFRPAGGHIHFGIGKIDEKKAIPIVKALDAILGIACVSLFENFDDPRRRRMYGLPGEYRLPPHGLEYRVLSNAWLFHPLIMNIVFDLARKAVVVGQKGYLMYWKVTEQEVIDTITFCDAEKAREILLRNKDMMLKLIKAAHYNYSSSAGTAFNVFMKGMESAIKNPNDIEGNWNINETWITHSDGIGKNWNTSKGALANGGKV